MIVRCENFRSRVNGKFQGFCDLVIEPLWRSSVFLRAVQIRKYRVGQFSDATVRGPRRPAEVRPGRRLRDARRLRVVQSRGARSDPGIPQQSASSPAVWRRAAPVRRVRPASDEPPRGLSEAGTGMALRYSGVRICWALPRY